MKQPILVLIFIFTICWCSFGLCQSIHGQHLYVHTVTGELPVDQLGFSLTHEHIMSNFDSAPSWVAKYDSTLVAQQVLPFLVKLKEMGVKSIFDCTTAYFGRKVQMLKHLSEVSGIQIITNTGYYGAAGDRYIPKSAYTETEKEIADFWINEFLYGIDSSSIRPGFIKLAFDPGEPSQIDLKLFRAGVLAHLQTGLTLVVHTQANIVAAKMQLEMLKRGKVSPNAWVWAHAHQVEEIDVLLEFATQGVWISFDGVNSNNVELIIEKLETFKERGLLHKMLLSHDGNTLPNGGPIRPYDAIQTILLPRLYEEGFTAIEIDLMMVNNVMQAFAVRVRRSEVD